MPIENLGESQTTFKSEAIVSSKGIIDGASTLSEAALLLYEEADFLRRLEEEGWKLIKTIENDKGYLEKSREDLFKNA